SPRSTLFPYTTLFRSQLRAFRKLLTIAGTDRTQAIELAREIERLEEQGDDVKDAMLDELYGSWEKLDYASFHNYLETTIEADDKIGRAHVRTPVTWPP